MASRRYQHTMIGQYLREAVYPGERLRDLRTGLDGQMTGLLDKPGHAPGRYFLGFETHLLPRALDWRRRNQ